MARTIDAILAELNQRTDPQRQSILKQVADLPNQQSAQEAGLQAKLDNAFGDIDAAANRRGILYSGVPIAEKSRYADSDFAPALANLRGQFNQRQTSLEDALNNIGLQNYTTAQDIFNQDRNFDLQQQQFAESQRQFNEQQAMAREQAARAAAGSGGGYDLHSGGDSGGVGNNNQGVNVPPQLTPDEISAYNDVRNRGQSGNHAAIYSDYLATLNSANRGNVRDQLKVQFYKQFYPQFLTPPQATAPAQNRNTNIFTSQGAQNVHDALARALSNSGNAALNRIKSNIRAFGF